MPRRMADHANACLTRELDIQRGGQDGALDAPLAASRRPRHLAAALLHRFRDLGAVDDLGHFEEIVRYIAARLGVANVERREKLVLARAIESLVRRQRDLRRQLEAL